MGLSGIIKRAEEAFPEMKKQELKKLVWKLEQKVEDREGFLKVMRRDPDLKNYLGPHIRFDTGVLKLRMENLES